MIIITYLLPVVEPLIQLQFDQRYLSIKKLRLTNGFDDDDNNNNNNNNNNMIIVVMMMIIVVEMMLMIV